MLNISMLTKEEAHWSSFRSAVVGLQHTLINHSSVSHTNGRNGHLPAKDKYAHHHRNDISSSASSHDAPRKKPQSALDDISKESTKPQYQLDVLDTWNLWDGKKSETGQTHQHLELIGLEEVNMSVHSRNNIVGNDLVSPANAPSHTSHTTIALSIAEQQLAETRLKLAMTESERDELEFQLMQNS
mmetsp:Transcript_22530/g.48798  ORF Transcript_22530/g.48798 Transcript_22530/m.48798 type:complete len:186 (+) Transcript_22530:148-705(+)